MAKMAEVDHDIPPSPAIDAVYALLNVIADPASALQRMDELDAKIDTLVIRTQELDDRERAVNDLEAAMIDKEQALDARDKSVTDMTALAADADRRVELANEAEVKLTEDKYKISAEFEQRDTMLKNAVAAVAAREAKVKALETDLAARTVALAANEADYTNRVTKLQNIVSGKQ